MFTLSFWQATFERAVRAAAAALISLWAGDGLFNALSIAWPDALGVAGGAGLLSVLFSLVGGAVNNTPGPSLFGTERVSNPNAPFTGGH